MEDFYYDRDPLRVENLPPGWDRPGTAFSYRSTATRGGRYRNPYTPYIVLMLSVLALAGLLALRFSCRYLPIASGLFSWQVLGLVVLIALADAVPSFLGNAPPSKWAVELLLPVFVWGLLVYVTRPSWLLLPIVLIATLYLTDALANNYMSWLLADARLDANVRGMVRRRWEKRFGQLEVVTALMSLFGENRRPQILDGYPIGFVLLPVAFVLALAGLKSFPGFTSGMLVFLALLAYLTLQGLFLPRLLRLRPVSLRLRVGVIARALGNWFNYNPRDRRGPGLHQSPYGSILTRLVLAIGGVLATSATLNLTTSYFPVLALGPAGTSPWERVLADRNASQSGADEPERPSLAADSDPEARLSPGERLYYRQLTGEAARRAYLDRVEERRALARGTGRDRRSASARLRATPEEWLIANGRGIFTGEAFFLWSYILAAVLGIVVPPLFLFVSFWSIAGYELALIEYRLRSPRMRQHARRGGEQPEESPSWYNPEWLAHVDSLHRSGDPLEREHLFLGYAQDFDTDDQWPVLVPRGLLGQHMHITGDSGSGKTSRGLASLTAQLARFARERGDCSLLVIDLKGDDALFQGLRHEAGDIPFEWYREQMGFSTFAFNPLLQAQVDFLNPDQRAQAVMDAFGLAYDVYGGRYYSDMQQSVLYNIFRAHPEIRSFAEIHEILQQPRARERLCPGMPHKAWDDGYHVREQIGSISRCRPLNETDDDYPMIDLPSLFVMPKIVYFYVPALIGGKLNQQVAKFALYTLLSSALFMPKHRRHQVYCVIDEFQEIVSANMGVILKQARNFNVSMILSNQIASDLNRGDAQLQGAVAGNTALKWSFRTSELDQQDALIKASGEYIETLRKRTSSASYSTRGWGTRGWTYSLSEGEAEQFRPAFGRNRLLWSSFRQDLSVLHASQGAGYMQFFRPFPCRTMYHISEALYDRRGSEPWPNLPTRRPRPGPAGLGSPGPRRSP